MLLLFEALLQLVISKSAGNDSPLTSKAYEKFINTGNVIAAHNLKQFLTMVFFPLTFSYDNLQYLSTAAHYASND
jgi:hypothetical protein